VFWLGISYLKMKTHVLKIWNSVSQISLIALAVSNQRNYFENKMACNKRARKRSINNNAALHVLVIFRKLKKIALVWDLRAL